ncbi:acyl-CoA N-acyltransferase [Ceraceosorus guamensis]|uniref:Acyl-CoA N-acyltransferase n=1 Tax=Ceraceosorus guamensis TaxID=1522189 RepID=A0A316VST3_9BASI|nr:acyl-CoA N-acyltransferase [Ceraceosorus guamensis]PWN40656.1 acyl-CoA N-acyltransferase [Ceraceosorus guamensis]
MLQQRGTVTTRPIESGDEARWRSLWEGYNAFYEREIAEKVTETTFARFLDPDDVVQAAVAVSPEGHILGFTTWMPHRSTSSIEDVVYLQDLFVDPSIRNGGAGRALIEHVYAEARRAKSPKVYWHTQIHNHRAQVSLTGQTHFALTRLCRFDHTIPQLLRC